MQGDSCLIKAISLENSLKVKEENHLLFVEAASNLVFPLLLNLSLLITASHSLLQVETEKGCYDSWFIVKIVNNTLFRPYKSFCKILVHLLKSCPQGSENTPSLPPLQIGNKQQTSSGSEPTCVIFRVEKKKNKSSHYGKIYNAYIALQNT